MGTVDKDDPPATAVSTETTEAAVARAYVQLWNTRDHDAIEELLTEEFIMYDPGAPADGIPGPKREVHGRDGLHRFVDDVTTGYPDFELVMGRLLTDDGVAMYEARITGTHEGPLGGLPPTGRPVDIPLVSTLAIEDGRVARHRVYFDMREVMEQLGLTFPAVIGQLPTLALGALRSRRGR